jgi:hypothetical protein
LPGLLLLLNLVLPISEFRQALSWRGAGASEPDLARFFFVSVQLVPKQARQRRIRTTFAASFFGRPKKLVEPD